MKKYLIFYSNVFITKGIHRAVIFDSHNCLYYIVPNELCTIIDHIPNLSVSEIYNKYKGDLENKKIISEYFDFLIKNNLAKYTHSMSSNNFLSYNSKYHSTSIIENAVVQISENNINSIFDTIYDLERLGTKCISLIFLSNTKIEIIRLIIKKCNINYIDAYFDYFENGINEFIEELYSLNFSLNSIKIFKSPVSKIENYVNDNVCFVNKSIEYCHELNFETNLCGVISPNYFNLQLHHFIESQNHNTCLNRKISIDANGEIKNCPSMAKSYGNIKDTKLIDVFNNPEFQKVWHIKKDEITKCKDCEFRNICTDCRAYLENPDDQYSAPLKCGYDPYTCTWEEWSTNPLKEKAIEFYGMQELVKNKDK